MTKANEGFLRPNEHPSKIAAIYRGHIPSIGRVGGPGGRLSGRLPNLRNLAMSSKKQSTIVTLVRRVHSPISILMAEKEFDRGCQIRSDASIY